MSEYIVDLTTFTPARQNGKQPIVSEEIVRCRDCSWFCEGSEVFATSDWCQNFDCETNEDGYCAWAERRDDE